MEKNISVPLSISQEILKSTDVSLEETRGYLVEHGVTLSIAGPRIDNMRMLRDSLGKSRSQSPIDHPYILVIDSTLMLGELKENIRALSTAFQPQTNTRFSAAILVKYDTRIDRPDPEFNFYFVSNPFAKFPISGQFERLFKSSS